MDANFFNDIEESAYVSYSSSEEEHIELPENYKKIMKQIKQMKYDEDGDCYYVDFRKILKSRYNSRIRYFNKFKRNHNLKFHKEADDLFLKLIDYMYYEKNFNYPYFIKNICDYYNIPNNIEMNVNSKCKKIWKDFKEKYL